MSVNYSLCFGSNKDGHAIALYQMTSVFEFDKNLTKINYEIKDRSSKRIMEKTALKERWSQRHIKELKISFVVLAEVSMLCS